MTLCVARDGATAEDVDGFCIGCGWNSADLFRALVAVYVDAGTDLTLIARLLEKTPWHTPESRLDS
jgi:hypothetical protein